MPRILQFARCACGARLEHEIDELGRVIDVCPACARNARGICRTCPRPLETADATHCPPCGERVRAEEEVLAQQRAALEAEDAQRPRRRRGNRRSAYRREWARKNPEKMAEYVRRLREKRRQARAAQLAARHPHQQQEQCA